MATRQFLKVAWLYLLCAGYARTQVITTFAGTDWFFPTNSLPAVNAPLGAINGVAVDGSGNTIITDPSNRMIMRILPAGTLNVIAGNGAYVAYSGDGGVATKVGLGFTIYGAAADSNGNVYFIEQI